MAELKETLGQKLQRTIERKAAEAEAQRLDLERIAREREAGKHVYVQNHFNKWKLEIIHFLEKGHEPQLLINDGNSYATIAEYCGMYGKNKEPYLITNSMNKYNHAWENFADWAKENDLRVEFVEVPKQPGYVNHWLVEITPWIQRSNSCLLKL